MVAGDSIDMDVVRHEDLAPGEHWMSIERRGGKNDGEKFRLVRATLDDGSKQVFWVSNARPGYFKQVFVPHSFFHPNMVI